MCVYNNNLIIFILPHIKTINFFLLPNTSFTLQCFFFSFIHSLSWFLIFFISHSHYALHRCRSVFTFHWHCTSCNLYFILILVTFWKTLSFTLSRIIAIFYEQRLSHFLEWYEPWLPHAVSFCMQSTRNEKRKSSSEIHSL